LNDTNIDLIQHEDRSLFASLKIRDYLFLWIGMTTSAFAMNMQIVAQGWLVYEMSGAALDLAWVSLAQTVPNIIFSLTGGVIADRFPKKPIIGFSPIINGAASLTMAIIIIFGDVTFWDFVWVAFVNGTVMALSIPSRTALIPEVVGERLMFNAIAYNMTAWNLARILGPALAGFTIAIIADGDTTSSFGVGLVFFVLSFLYFISGVTVLFIHHKGEPVNMARGSALKDVSEGIRYLFKAPVVGGLMLLTGISFMFGSTINALLPAFNTDVLSGGPDDLGLLMTGMGVGAILGSLTAAKTSSLRHKGYWLLSIGAFWGLALTGLAFTWNLFQAMFAISLIGFMSTFAMSMNRSVVQLQVARYMRGRIMSFDMMAHGLMPLGLIPIGYIAQTISIEAGLATSGSLLFVCMVILGFMMPKIRTIDTGFLKN
jgi:MFS family permease